MKKSIRKLSMVLSILLLFSLASPACYTLQTQAVDAQAQTIQLNKTKLNIYNGKTYKLKVSGTDHAVSWSTSDKKTVAVNQSGKIAAKRVGTAVITAKVNGQRLKCKVTVKSPLRASATAVSVYENREKNVQITFKLSGTVRYEVEDYSIVSCEWSKEWENDTTTLTITGKHAGVTCVTITNNKTSDVLKIKVRVKYNGAALTTDQSSVSLLTGIEQTVYVYSKEYGDLVCSVADPSIVSADIGYTYSSGKSELTLTGKANGTTTVTVKNQSTGSKLKIKVIVKASIVIRPPYLPKYIGEYDYRDQLVQGYMITDFHYEIGSYDKDDDNYTVYLYFGGEKTYDRRGPGQSSSAEIGWKLYDEDGSVVDSDTCYSPSVCEGDTWKAKAAKDYIFDLDAGNYTIEILSTN